MVVWGPQRIRFCTVNEKTFNHITIIGRNNCLKLIQKHNTPAKNSAFLQQKLLFIVMIYGKHIFFLYKSVSVPEAIELSSHCCRYTQEELLRLYE